MNDFGVVAAAGSLRSTQPSAVHLPHRWTDEGVTVEMDFTGAHLLHLSAAACVLNDLYREAAALGVPLDGVRVSAAGGFDTETWRSTGITYVVELASRASVEDQAKLVAAVDAIAEIPQALRAGMEVHRAQS